MPLSVRALEGVVALGFVVEIMILVEDQAPPIQLVFLFLFAPFYFGLTFFVTRRRSVGAWAVLLVLQLFWAAYFVWLIVDLLSDLHLIEIAEGLGILGWLNLITSLLVIGLLNSKGTKDWVDRRPDLAVFR